RQPQPGADAPRGQHPEQRRRLPGHRHGAQGGQQRGSHRCRLPVSRRTTSRSTSDSAPPICATKWLSTTSVSPPPASASRIRRALYSSRLAVAVYRYALPTLTLVSQPLRCRLSIVLITVV